MKNEIVYTHSQSRRLPFNSEPEIKSSGKSKENLIIIHVAAILKLLRGK